MFDKFIEKVKPWLCGDYWFGNLFFWLWDYERIDCQCCVFWRGMVIGGILGALFGVII